MDNINMTTENQVCIITPKQVKKLVEEALGINDLSTKSRTRPEAQGRHIYYKLAKKFCRYAGLRTIGEAVKRDHSTVVHGLTQYDYDAGYDTYMKDVYDLIYNKLDGNYIPPGRNDKVDITFERIIERITKLEQQLNTLINDKNK